jgi:hypothetical protein
MARDQFIGGLLGRAHTTRVLIPCKLLTNQPMVLPSSATNLSARISYTARVLVFETPRDSKWEFQVRMLLIELGQPRSASPRAANSFSGAQYS